MKSPIVALLAASALALLPFPERKSVVDVEVLATGLTVPWSIAVGPGFRVFFTERPGRIRVITSGKLLDSYWASIPVLDGNTRNIETGLMGLALDPDFERNPYVYVCYTFANGAEPLMNRVARLRESGGHGVGLQVLVDSIPAGPDRNGCPLKFGPDGKLYIGTGDAHDDANAQDAYSLAGKILRVNADGTIPDDNPDASSRIWATGLRNPQALAFEPGTGRLVLLEHGSGDVDEVNIIRRGGNYGWPVIRGAGLDRRFIEPVLVFHAAPAGATFLSGRVGVRGLVVATLSGMRRMRFHVDSASARIVEDTVLSGYGRLRDVVEAPDGSLLVATSNRDRRGQPTVDDDRILRVRFPR